MTRVEHIGNCQLILADCRDVLPTLGHVDTVVTDLPYGIARPDKKDGINTPRDKGGYSTAFEDTQDNLKVLAGDLCAFIEARKLRAAITPSRANMWHYSQPTDVGMFYQPAAVGMSYWGRATWQPILYYGKDPYNGKTIQPLHYILTEKPEKNGHPCPKPIKAWTWLVNRASKPADVVFDPCFGSGTTAVACVALGRKFVGVEISEEYFNIAVERIRRAHDQLKLFEECSPPAALYQERVGTA